MKEENFIKVIFYNHAENFTASALTQLDDREHSILTKEAIGTLVITGLFILILGLVITMLVWKKSRYKILKFLTNKVYSGSDEILKEEFEEIKHSVSIDKK